MSFSIQNINLYLIGGIFFIILFVLIIYLIIYYNPKHNKRLEEDPDSFIEIQMEEEI